MPPCIAALFYCCIVPQPLHRNLLMSLSPTIFREYDIRGLVPSEVNVDSIALIAKAFGTHLRSLDLKTISVGGDVRTHTRELMDAFITAINATGIDVIEI